MLEANMTPELGSAGPGPAVCVPLLATSPCAAQGPSSAGGGGGAQEALESWSPGLPCALRVGEVSARVPREAR